MRLLLTLFAVLLACAAPARAGGLQVMDLRVPMAAAGSAGLEAVLVEPAGSGRHPLAIVSHGSPRDAAARPGMRARDLMPQLLQFARRGYVAVSVLRRGYGTSGGGWAEAYGSCDDADYTKAGEAAAADLRAAIAFLSHRGDVDSSKILAVGVSAGGFATVALTADPPPGLVAAISFAGGRGSSGPDDVCDESALARAFSSYGERSRTPMLWVYAKNDRFFGPPLAKNLLTAFQRGGGDVAFVSAPPFGDDGHALFSAAGIPEWAPLVERFLSDQNLPSSEEDSQATALDPPGQLSAEGRTAFESFLNAAGHKAFAVGERGGYAWRSNRSSVQEATSGAIAECERLSHATCTAYAIDDALAEAR